MAYCRYFNHGSFCGHGITYFLPLNMRCNIVMLLSEAIMDQSLADFSKTIALSQKGDRLRLQRLDIGNARPWF